MQNNLIKAIMALALVTLVAVPLPVRAQTPDLGMSISVNPTSVSPGGTVGVFALVTNNTSSKLRTTVYITSLSACGTQTSLGYNKLALNPGQTVQVTVSYPLPPNACLGMYTVSISAKSGAGKNSAASAAVSASASLTVQ
jgi:uncharacterized membrane protein